MMRYVILGLVVIVGLLGFATQHYRSEAQQESTRADQAEDANQSLQTSLNIATARFEMLRLAGDQRDEKVTKSESKADEAIKRVPETSWGSQSVDSDVLRAIRLPE